MLNLEYDSDDDSDGETVQTQTKTSSTPSPNHPNDAAAASHAVGGGLQLPPPTNKSTRRRDGPVKIKIDALDPAVKEPGSEPLSKKPLPDARGAGSSSLVSMLSKLPAPKAAPSGPPMRALGGGVKPFDDPGLLADSFSDGAAAPSKIPGAGDRDSSASATSFVPTSIAKPKSKLAPPESRLSSSLEALPITLPPSTSLDFFSLGSKAETSRSSSKPISPTPTMSISSAPSVTEWHPPPPSVSDPYPGYYQKPSGEWTAYDPEYYKSFWETWNRVAVKDAQNKGKRKERGWEGAEDDDLETVDAQEEMHKSQLADREATKNLTTAPNAAGPVQPNMNIKTGHHARRRGQLSSLLVEAYQNREVIETKLAEGRRNRKEAGLKYGF